MSRHVFHVHKLFRVPSLSSYDLYTFILSFFDSIYRHRKCLWLWAENTNTYWIDAMIITKNARNRNILIIIFIVHTGLGMLEIHSKTLFCSNEIWPVQVKRRRLFRFITACNSSFSIFITYEVETPASTKSTTFWLLTFHFIHGILAFSKINSNERTSVFLLPGILSQSFICSFLNTRFLISHSTLTTENCRQCCVRCRA